MATDHYLNEIHTKYRYRPTWPPDKELRLGDVGVYDDGVFRRQATLDDFDIDFDTRTDEDPAGYGYQSGRGITMQSKAEGESPEGFEAIGEAAAGLRIEFNQGDTIVFAASACRIQEIDNKLAVKRAITERADENGEWQPEYAVITELVEAGSTTVLIADSAGGAVELQGTSSINLGGAGIASLEADIEAVYAENLLQKTVASENATPLFGTTKLNKDLWERLRDLFDTATGRGRPEADTTSVPGSVDEAQPPIDDTVIDAMFVDERPDGSSESQPG